MRQRIFQSEKTVVLALYILAHRRPLGEPGLARCRLERAGCLADVHIHFQVVVLMQDMARERLYDVSGIA